MYLLKKIEDFTLLNIHEVGYRTECALFMRITHIGSM